MIAIFAAQMSRSGDTHESLVAVFTTPEKADAFLTQLRDYFPKERFYTSKYYEPKVDPDFTDFIMEGSYVAEDEHETTCNES